MRGIRGATTAETNTAEAIHHATAELLQALVHTHDLRPDEIVAAFFTATPDLDAAFPATVARQQLGWGDVPLLDLHQMSVPTDLPRCIRVLLLVERDRREPVKPQYLRGARALRPDLAHAVELLLGESSGEDERGAQGR